ncbi:MAG: zinc ribbon domain-containing protein [Clostridia bacterium]|nr:zinc ribbon domain-containing protein [Clostridia bacterium]
MFCPFCGTEIPDEVKVCPNCEKELPEEEIAEAAAPAETPEVAPEAVPAKKKSFKWLYVLYRVVKLAAFCALAVYVYQRFQAAASNISYGGMMISYIESVGGKTLEEAYYAQLGNIYSGYTILTRASGAAISGILVGLGLTK